MQRSFCRYAFRRQPSRFIVFCTLWATQTFAQVVFCFCFYLTSNVNFFRIAQVIDRNGCTLLLITICQQVRYQSWYLYVAKISNKHLQSRCLDTILACHEYCYFYTSCLQLFPYLLYFSLAATQLIRMNMGKNVLNFCVLTLLLTTINYFY